MTPINKLLQIGKAKLHLQNVNIRQLLQSQNDVLKRNGI
jgi:hypothetical protein